MGRFKSKYRLFSVCLLFIFSLGFLGTAPCQPIVQDHGLYLLFENQLFENPFVFHSFNRPLWMPDSLEKKWPISGKSKDSNGFCLRSYGFDKELDEDIHVGVMPILSCLISYNKDFHIDYDAGAGLSFKLKNKLQFYGNFVYSQENVASPLGNHLDTLGIVPQFGKYRKKNGQNVQYTNSVAYLSYTPFRFLNFQGGYGRNFFGDGNRSLLLSDQSNAYPFFKSKVALGRIQYVHLLGFLRDGDPFAEEEQGFQRKYMVAHALSVNLTKRINLNLFESVIWHSRDSLGWRGFDVNYLNPVVFYRPVEFASGSKDNVLMGAGFRFRFLKKTHLYGQFLLDEFLLKEIKSANGWWGNKYGFQVGVKSFDLFKIENLMARIEYNEARPYTYSHERSFENYGHFLQPLAHPLGANFKERLLCVNYYRNRLFAEFSAVYANYGTDIAGDTIPKGGDIYRSYINLKNYIQNHYGHKTGQGIENIQQIASLRLSYLINPAMNIRAELGCAYRKFSFDGQEELELSFYAGIKTRLLSRINY